MLTFAPTRTAVADPDAFTPDLAMALTNQSDRLADLGRREEALAASTEAVTPTARWPPPAPTPFTPDLAMSLNNQSDRLAALGRREEALAAITEAVAIYRELAAARPDALPPRPGQGAEQPVHRLASWAGARRRWPPSPRPSPSTGGWPPPARTPSSPTWPGR